MSGRIPAIADLASAWMRLIEARTIMGAWPAIGSTRKKARRTNMATPAGRTAMLERAGDCAAEDPSPNAFDQFSLHAKAVRLRRVSRKLFIEWSIGRYIGGCDCRDAKLRASPSPST